jgi:alkylated DNA repair dioxygenase AlkB
LRPEKPLRRDRRRVRFGVVARQIGLFSRGRLGFDNAFATLRRTTLSNGAWVDYQPGWLAGDNQLFEMLLNATAWQTERRWLYGRMVDTPRLIAGPEDVPDISLLAEMRDVLSAHYREKFTRLTLALYRDGRDSVAFHGDTAARDMDQATVATVSVGSPRRLLLKPAAAPRRSRSPITGRQAVAFTLGGGDLLVMGGSCQRTWRHGIPKVASSGPRIAIMFRPDWYRWPIERPTD